jgi:hypothetical protein
MRRRSRAERLYRLLLRLFPSEFRGDFGDEMSTVFRDERAEAAARGRFALTRLWLRTFRGLASAAPREHADVLIRDAAYGVRLMRKHPLTTAAAMLAIALGVGVTSNTATATLSGTSMASPHVAGAAALYKQANPSASSTTIRNALVNNATTNVISNVGTGSPNRLLYTLFF